ncbi:MAG: MOSC domain-containing protein [Alphaproteobacteria bacterium]|nr:MOSC domain-containing protein [Alphaproteobacteria bacterium]
MKVEALYIYPLKGGAAVRQDSAEVTPKGLKHDRVLMVVEPDTGKFITQRENPVLATIGAAVTDKGVILTAEGKQPLYLDWASLEQGQKAAATVWKDKADVLTTPPDASAWLSDVLGQGVQLVYQPERFSRKTSPDFAPQGDNSFADGYPLLVAFTASLDDLNEKITAGGEQAVGMERFRANIVVSSDKPWAEDTIGSIKAGATDIALVKPCPRCVVTTIDQEKGVKAGREPMKTLATMRFSPLHKGALFAENAVPLTMGQIRVGDEVKALSEKPAPSVVVKKKKQAVPQ